MFHGVFSMILFCQICQSTIVLAITIVSMANVDTTVLIGKCCYLGILLAQNALFCYLCNEVYNEVILLIHFNLLTINTGFKRFSQQNCLAKHFRVNSWTLTNRQNQFFYFYFIQRQLRLAIYQLMDGSLSIYHCFYPYVLKPQFQYLFSRDLNSKIFPTKVI